MMAGKQDKIIQLHQRGQQAVVIGKTDFFVRPDSSCAASMRLVRDEKFKITGQIIINKLGLERALKLLLDGPVFDQQVSGCPLDNFSDGLIFFRKMPALKIRLKKNRPGSSLAH